MNKILLIVIGIIAIVGVGFFIRKQTTMPTPKVQELSTIVPSIVAQTSPMVVDDQWKRYTDQQNKFSIEYPPQYKVETAEVPAVGKNPSTQVVKIEPTDDFNKKEPLAVTYGISIAAIPNTNNYTLANPRELFGKGPLLQYLPSMLGNTEVKEIMLGGIKAYRVDGCCGGPGGDGGVDILTIKDNKLYEIVIDPRQLEGNPDANKSLYESILSTFIFE